MTGPGAPGMPGGNADKWTSNRRERLSLSNRRLSPLTKEALALPGLLLAGSNDDKLRCLPAIAQGAQCLTATD